MAAYRFVTHWRLDASAQRVWAVLDAPEGYTKWWPAIRTYRDLTPHCHGVGSRAERVVQGVLPYRLRYETVVTRYDPPRQAEYASTGDLVGWGRLTVTPDGDATRVTFEWNVRTARVALNVLAPLLKPIFAWNHNWVMAQGERGLGAELARG